MAADPPIKDIHTFVGTVTHRPRSRTTAPGASPPTPSSPPPPQTDPLTADNLLWANTVLAAGSAVGFVVYTGRQTRAVMNTSHPETKVGLLDLEINRIAKILCAGTFALSVLLVALNGFRGQWYVYVFRFLILFSSIIPIRCVALLPLSLRLLASSEKRTCALRPARRSPGSLRVNLDMGKTVYAHSIQTDGEIPGTIVRTSTLPEELGRIEYLLSDKVRPSRPLFLWTKAGC